MGRRCSARQPWLAGNWSLDTTLAAGTYNNLKVTVTDLAGNANTTANAQTIIVDATPPSETFPTVTLTSDSGASNSDFITSTGGVHLPARLPTPVAPALPACRCLTEHAARHGNRGGRQLVARHHAGGRHL